MAPPGTQQTLRDYWSILRRRKGIVLFMAALLGFSSFIVSTIWQPVLS